ncbi:MAG: hypothetical protein Kow0031_38320 [Anaerolineae bacterium]
MSEQPSAEYSYQPLQPHHLAHDLRGPLNSMLGFTELLLDGIEGPLNDIQTEDLTAMWHSAQNLLNLINAYVDLSRLNAGQLNLESSPVHPGDALRMVVKELSATEAAANVTFEVVIPENLPSVAGDFNRVVQTIKLPAQFLVEALGHGTISVGVDTAGNGVEFTLLAAAVSLPPAEFTELFEQTVRVDAAGRARLSAGGIYLPLAYQLALALNGRLSVSSSPETGTAFSLSLPLFQAE